MSIGLDPEFFIVDGSHHIVPAEKFLDSAEGDVAFDNAAVEIRPEQSSCIQGFLSNVRETFHHAMMKMRLARLQGRIPSTSHLSLTPAARLRAGDMNLPSVQQFGCSPSLVVEKDGSLSHTTAQVDPLGFAYRSAGYHVHVGVAYHTTPEALANITALADVFVGLVDVMMVGLASRSWVRGSQIRRLAMGYGRAGEHRVREIPARAEWANPIKVWEYRTLSPWPLSHPLWSWWAQSAVRHCQIYGNHYNNPLGALKPKLPNRSEVVDVINNCDLAGARELWLAAVRAASGGLTGRDGNDALTPLNIRKLFYCLDRRGYETLSAGWTPETAWFRNIMPKKEQWSGQRAPTPRLSQRAFMSVDGNKQSYRKHNKSTSPRHYNITNYTRHEEGKITTFPTGFRNYFRLIEQTEPTIPELPNA
jgi:hypothetical protein